MRIRGGRAAAGTRPASSRTSPGSTEVAPPAGLTVELRPYQRRGLDWLQFLRA